MSPNKALKAALAACERVSERHQTAADEAAVNHDPRRPNSLLRKSGADECAKAIRELIEQAAVTTAGRRDDPRSVRVPCRPLGRA